MVASFIGIALAPAPLRAWTPGFETALASEASRLAPPDLARQIERREEELRRGVVAAASAGEAGRLAGRRAGSDPTSALADALVAESERAVVMIRELSPFDDVVHQLGVVAHLVAQAHNPLEAGDADPREGEYFADYARYAASAEPRFPLVFYGLRPRFDEPADLRALVAEALAGGRDLYPALAREYARIGYASGVGRFDDRSTAFGVTSIAFSRAASDIAQVLRYIWLRAGGTDQRTALPRRGGRQLVRIPRHRSPAARR